MLNQNRKKFKGESDMELTKIITEVEGLTSCPSRVIGGGGVGGGVKEPAGGAAYSVVGVFGGSCGGSDEQGKDRDGCRDPRRHGL